ncbi:MAG: Gfo/Idh/MocA family protein [Promethearchaeota archaeon]
MMGKFLKVAIVGGGGIFGSHSMAYPENPNAVPVAFIDVIPSRAKESYDVILNHHLEPALEYYLEDEPENSAEIDRLQYAIDALKERGVSDNIWEVIDDVDMFDVCTPNKFHVPYAIIALENGKSVMTEKPPARNWWELKVLKEVANRSKGFYQINENEFFRPLWHAIADAVAEGKIGQIKSVSAQLGHGGPTWGFHGHFFDPYYNGGGCTQDLGVHALGIMMASLGWLHGRPLENLVLESVKTRKMEKRRQKRKLKTIRGEMTFNAIDFEDYAKFNLKFQHPDGYTFKGTLETTWAAPLQGYCKIEGTEGIISPNVVRGQYVAEIYDKKGELIEQVKPKRDKYGNRDSHEREVLYFTDIVNNNQGPSMANEDVAFNLEQMISLAYYGNAFAKKKEVTPAEMEKWANNIAKRCGVAKDAIVDELVSILMKPFRQDL